jgi:hypothetical protein
MKEHFTISFPNSLSYPNLPKILISALLSALIIYPILGLSTIPSYLCLAILFILFC